MDNTLYQLFNEIRDLKDEIKILTLDSKNDQMEAKKDLGILSKKVDGISSQSGHSARVLDSIVESTYMMPNKYTIKIGALPGTFDISSGRVNY